MKKCYVFKAMCLLVLLVFPFVMHAQTYHYTDNPGIQTFTACSMGTYSGTKFNYNTCSRASGTQTYTKGHIRSSLWNYESGNFTFRLIKCEGNFQRGHEGKVFFYETTTNTTYCVPYSTMYDSPDHVDITFYIGNFTGTRTFHVYLITSGFQNYLYGGCHTITGSTSSSSNCSWDDCSTGDCGGGVRFTHDENYRVAQYLCSNNIIDNGYVTGGYLRPNDTILRAELAKVALNALFNGANNVPNLLVSDYFPCIYPELDRSNVYNDWYYRAAKALMYLEYGDGVSPFDRNLTSFRPGHSITRRLVLKVLLETFNIAPSTSTVGVFDDFSPSDAFYGYAKKAYELGICQTTHFRPYDNCTRIEAFHFVYRMLTLHNITRPNVNNTADINTSDFFIPSNLSPECLNAMQGVEHGNFQHYTRDCFSIPGWVDMNFGFTYQSLLSQEPDEYYPINPLGNKTWTHTYNMYINTIVDNYTGTDVNWYYLHMNDGNVVVYKDSDYGIEKVSKGDYNTLTMVSSSEFVLTTVDQVSCRFKKLSTSKPIYYLTSVVNRFGDSIKISYQTFGSEGYRRINKVSSGTGEGYRELVFSYNGSTQRLSQVTGPCSRTINFQYNSNQNLSQYTDAKGQNTYYYYDNIATGKDLLRRLVLPNGNTVYNDYQQRKLTSTRVNTNPATTISYNYQYSNGQRSAISQVTQPTLSGNSVTTHYTINEYGRFTHVTDNYHIDDSIFYEYSDTHPTLPSRTQNNLTEVVTDYSYNAYGQPTETNTYSVATDATDAVVVRNRWRYNSDHTTSLKIGPMGDSTRYYYSDSGAVTSVVDPMGHTVSFQNNSHGKPSRVTMPNGCETTITYTPRGLVSQTAIPTLGIGTSLTYDDVGRVTSSTDAMGNTTTYSYDNNDNTTGVQDALGNTTSVAFDANDNPISITNAIGNSTYMQYDDNDFMTSISFQGHTKSYTYYDDGKLNTYTDPNGHQFEFTYNPSNQVLSDGYATYTYYSDGLLKNITKDGMSIRFYYDDLSRVERVSYDGISIYYTYDAAGHRLTEEYPGNKTVTYTYNQNGQMTSVTDWNGNTTNYFYRSNDGLLNYVQLPNGVRTTYSYDNAGRMIGQVTRRNSGMGSVITQCSYTLDNNGMHTAEQSVEPYTSMPPIASENITYTYNSSNRLLTAGSIGFNYDNNGNTLTKGSRHYTWDHANNITGVSGDISAAYTYDGAGNRRTANRGDGTIKYVLDIMSDNANVIMETDEYDSPICYYIYGADGLLARVGADGVTTHYYISDFRGSIVAMVDASSSANITHQYQYDDFGKVLQSQESFFNPFRYVGNHGLMYETEDLYFCRARYYDPTIGRFLSEDPVWDNNLYPYAGNNPVNAIDVDGNDLIWMVVDGMAALPAALYNAAISCVSMAKGVNALFDGNVAEATYYMEKADEEVWAGVKGLGLAMAHGYSKGWGLVADLGTSAIDDYHSAGGINLTFAKEFGQDVLSSLNTFVSAKTEKYGSLYHRSNKWTTRAKNGLKFNYKKFAKKVNAQFKKNAKGYAKSLCKYIIEKIYF